MDVLKKLIDEYNFIDRKIEKLEKALKTVPLDKTEKCLLIKQKEFMKGYRRVVNDRINYTEKKFGRL